MHASSIEKTVLTTHFGVDTLSDPSPTTSQPFLTGMSLRVGHRSVDQAGLVSLPYLKKWGATSHNLVGLVESLSTVFGAEPPVSRSILDGFDAFGLGHHFFLLACCAPAQRSGRCVAFPYRVPTDK